MFKKTNKRRKNAAVSDTAMCSSVETLNPIVLMSATNGDVQTSNATGNYFADVSHENGIVKS